MKREEIIELLMDVINDIQESSGRELEPILEKTVLTNDLNGFDSLNAVEAAAMMSDALLKTGQGIEVPVEIFLSDGNRPASFGYVVDSILEKLESQS